MNGSDIGKIQSMLPCLSKALETNIPGLFIDGVWIAQASQNSSFSHVVMLTTITKLVGYTMLFETTGHRLYIGRDVSGAIQSVCEYFAYLGDPHCSEAKYNRRMAMTAIINNWWNTVTYVLDEQKHACALASIIKQELIEHTPWSTSMTNPPLH
jgi:hypothetical protein